MSRSAEAAAWGRPSIADDGPSEGARKDGQKQADAMRTRQVYGARRRPHGPRAGDARGTERQRRGTRRERLGHSPGEESRRERHGGNRRRTPTGRLCAARAGRGGRPLTCPDLRHVRLCGCRGVWGRLISGHVKPFRTDKDQTLECAARSLGPRASPASEVGASHAATHPVSPRPSCAPRTPQLCPRGRHHARPRDRLCFPHARRPASWSTSLPVDPPPLRRRRAAARGASLGSAARELA